MFYFLLLSYNCGRIIFFILSFFVGYILSFGFVRLRTIRLCARAGTHIERWCSRSCAEDMTITDVIIKTPDRKYDWGANDVLPGSDGLEFLVILKKAVSWDSDLGESSWVYGMCRAFVGSVSWDPKLGEASWDLKLDEASPVCGLRDAPRVCWVTLLRFRPGRVQLWTTGCAARLLGQAEQLA